MKIQNTISRVFGSFVVAGVLTLATHTAQASYQSTVLADHPLAFYALNPATDGTDVAPDLSGNENDGTVIGDYSSAQGPSAYIPNAAYFDGAGLVDLSMGNNPGLLIYNGPMTLEAWVQPANSGEFADIIAEGYESASGYPEIALRANGPYGGNYAGGSENANFDVYVNGGAETTNWCHIVVTMDGTNAKIYQNGALVGSVSDTNGSTIFPSPDDWCIGDGSDQGNTRLWDGNISEVAMYNYGLSATQVAAHYNEGMYGSTNPPPPATGPALKWSPNNNTGTWDTGISTNWIIETNGQPSVFNTSDSVLFDDTTGVPAAVTVSGTVSPSLITVDASVNNFTISGGTLGGTGGLVKEGTSTLTIDTVGLVGPVTIGGGLIYAGNNSLDAASSITISNGATLDLAGGTFSADTPVTVSGEGVNNEGAIFNSYSDYPGETLDITMTGDTKFGGTARFDLASGAQISGPYDLTLDFSSGGGYTQWNTVTVGATVPEVSITNGTSLGMSYDDTACLNPATVFTVNSGSQLTFYNGGFNGSINVLSGGTTVVDDTGATFSGSSIADAGQVIVYNGGTTFSTGTIHVLTGGIFYLYSSGINFTGNNLILDDNSQFTSYYNSGSNVINNAVTLNGVAHIILGDHNEDFTGVVSGPGGFVLDYYNQELVLSAANTYTGPTVIGDSGNNPEVALTGNGSISDSSLIFFGGTDPTVAHFDVSGRSDDTLTLASGQTLAGIGGISGNLVVAAGATISPAGTNTAFGISGSSNPVGALAASGNVSLSGTTVIKLDGSGTNDQVEAAGDLGYGGTLELENISGSTLAAGNSFQIFSAANISGSFASITPATPGAGLAWNTSQLSSGIIGVQSGPTISAPHLSGNNIILSGTGGTPNATYYILTTTNLATNNWTPIATNNYSTNGTFSATNAIILGAKQQFFMIK